VHLVIALSDLQTAGAVERCVNLALVRAPCPNVQPGGVLRVVPDVIEYNSPPDSFFFLGFRVVSFFFVFLVPANPPTQVGH
jgi:hypothetical protein